MHLLRALRRSALAALLVASVTAIGAAPAGAATVKPIMFPVDGAVTYTDTFGACRGTACERTHEGQDLMGKKMTKLVSAVDGVVHRLVFNNTSSGGNSVTIKAADGWTYHYIHVNNDTPGTDDAKATRAQAFPSNIVVGASVTKGQLIAYMGDSGNAESTGSHLHFEIRQPPPPGGYTGTAINPYASLQAATRLTGTKALWDLRRTADAGPATEQFSYGLQLGDRGLLCDWDLDGQDEVVIVRKGTWYLRDGTSIGNATRDIAFGTVDDTPMCADVDGDGADEPVLFRNGTWTVRAGFEVADAVAWTVRYGLQAGDVPVLGDWDGDGDDDIAIHRNRVWYIRSTAQPTGVTVTSFMYGMVAGDRPVVGDWDGDGDDDAGIFRNGWWHLRSTAEKTGATASSFAFGSPTAQPVVGYGTDPVKPGVGTFRPAG